MLALNNSAKKICMRAAKLILEGQIASYNFSMDNLQLLKETLPDLDLT